DLLEAGRVHEVPVLAIGVQELHVGIHHVRTFQRVGRLHGDLLGTSGLDAAVLDPGKGLTLARLDEIRVNNDAGVVVDQDLQPVFDVVQAVGGHGGTPAMDGWREPAHRTFDGPLECPVVAGRTGRKQNWTRMIPAGPFPIQPDPIQPDPAPQRWQQLWREAVRDPRELAGLLGLDPATLGISDDAARQFALRVPRGFVARMRYGDPHDPLLRQVMPLDAEMQPMPGFSLDAVGDGAASAGSGVIRKYRGRALLIATGSCAINCRYCFRRHFP